MKRDTYKVDANDTLYIRLPDDLKDDAVIHLTIPAYHRGETIKVVALYRCEDAGSFSEDTIQGSLEHESIDYYGEEKSWEPEVQTETYVEGHPNCRFSECPDCHVVSCAIWQGYEEARPHQKKFLTSPKLRQE